MHLSGQTLRVLYIGEVEIARAECVREASPLELIAPVDLPTRSARHGDLAPSPFDLVLIDYGSAGGNAAAVLGEFREQNLDAPIVLAVSPEAAGLALELDADGYIVKRAGWFARLPRQLEVVLSRRRHLGQLELLRASEARLRSIVERVPVCLVRIASDGTLLAVNEAALSMLEAVRLHQVLRTPFYSFIDSEDREKSQEFVKRACAGEPASVELAMTGLSGIGRTVEASAIALNADSNGVLSALLVLRDMTERRRLEASVLEAHAAPGPELMPPVTHDELTKRMEALQALERRLRDAEAERLVAMAERDERDKIVRALRDELGALAAANRSERQELINVLHASGASEQLARRRLVDCRELEELLRQVQTELQQLSERTRLAGEKLADRRRDGAKPDQTASAGPEEDASELWRIAERAATEASKREPG